MFVIVGLGNPGAKYEETRHNVGFKTIDILAKQLKVDLSKKKFKALVGEGNLCNQKVVLIKPQTYMNLSGESVYNAISWYKIPLSNLIIIYDDIDLPVGKLRIRRNGSAGTHNGMRSILDYIQSEEFPRIRIGVGAPPHKEFDLADYVLSRFTSEEKPQVDTSLHNAAEAAMLIVQNDIAAAMNRFN